MHDPSRNQKLLTFKETAVFLCVTESWLRSAVFKKQIPYIKMGRLIRFKESSLVAWVGEKEIGGFYEK